MLTLVDRQTVIRITGIPEEAYHVEKNSNYFSVRADAFYRGFSGRVQ